MGRTNFYPLPYLEKELGGFDSRKGDILLLRNLDGETLFFMENQGNGLKPMKVEGRFSSIKVAEAESRFEDWVEG